MTVLLRGLRPRIPSLCEPLAVVHPTRQELRS